MIRSHTKTIREILGRDPVHPFPARMAPGIALEVIAAARAPLRILDPMVGSGTVLAVARSQGHRAMGIDIDPLAVLISKVWTTAVDGPTTRRKAAEALGRARRACTRLSGRNSYPAHADAETRRFIEYWFDTNARRQLAALAAAIRHERDEPIRDVLWCGLSRLIIAKQAGASLALDLPHSRPHRAYDRAPAKPLQRFLAAVDRVLENCLDKAARRRGPTTRVTIGDARALPLAADTIDLVLTSPPYLNAIDYMRCSKFSLVWMGHGVSELRRVRHDSIGTEAGGKEGWDDGITRILADLGLRPRLPMRQEAILRRYIDDMRCAMQEVSRVLVPGGKAVFVVGENTIRGTFVRNSVVVETVADLAGLKLVERRVRTLPRNRRYLPPPTNGSASTASLDARIRREVVLAFARPRGSTAKQTASLSPRPGSAQPA